MHAWKTVFAGLAAAAALRAEWVRIVVVNRSTSAWVLQAPLGLTWTTDGDRLWDAGTDAMGRLGTLWAGGEVTFTLAAEETGGHLEVRPLDQPTWQRLTVQGPSQTFYFLDDAASRGAHPVIATPVPVEAGRAETAPPGASARPVLGGPGSAFGKPVAAGVVTRPPASLAERVPSVPGGPGSAFRSVEAEKKTTGPAGPPG